MNRFLKNISYTIMGNGVYIIVTACTVLIIPRYISLEDYGLWQLFLFYFSYVGIFHFGWEDGIYLRYAGVKYNCLNKTIISTQILAIELLQLLIGIIIFCYATFCLSDNISLLVSFLSIALFLKNTINLYSYILQMTSQFQRYALVMMIDSLVFLISSAVCFFYGTLNFYQLVLCKLLSLLIVLLMGGRFLYQIVIPNRVTFYKFWDETKENLSAGTKMMFANLTGMLVLGIIRFGISKGWDIVTFGKVSLTISLSNFFLVFIGAVSVVLLPSIKNLSSNVKNELYKYIRTLLNSALFILLLCYFPANILLSIWLPKYLVSLKYMALVLPICIFECRMSLLVNTYLKAMRKEKVMLEVNIIAVLFSALITLITVFYIHNLLLCIASIVLIFGFRALIAELRLLTFLGYSLNNDIIRELIMIIGFIICAWLIDDSYGVLWYIIMLMWYLFTQKRNIKEAVSFFKTF